MKELTFKEIIEFFNIKSREDLKNLAKVFEIPTKEIKNCRFYEKSNYLFTDCSCRQFLIFDNYDAVKEFAKDKLSEIYEECYAPEVPEPLQYYIDVEAWIEDVLLSDGAGSILAPYDSEEREFIVDDKIFFIYRIN